MVKSETSINNDNSDIIEHFKSKITSESGKIDFLNGININKTEDFYWEKVKHKETKTYSFNYYLKYPFANSKLQELIATYKQKDYELTQELDKYLDIANNIESTEQIAATISALKKLRENFIDRRQDKADLAIEKLYSYYKNAEIKVLSNASEKLCFSLYLDGKELETAIKPMVKSNCARIVNLNKAGNAWELQYDSQDCYPDEENYFTISLYLPKNRIKKNVFIDVTQNIAKISLVGEITIKKDSMGTGNKCSLSIKSEYTSPLSIESIKLEFGKNNILNVSDLHKRFEGGGIYTLDVTIPKSISLDNKTGIINGYISYKSVNSAKILNYRIYKYRYNLSL